MNLSTIAETIKRMAFKVTRAGELIGREVARARCGAGPVRRFGIVDLSLAPTPAVGDSVAEILEAMGVERPGAPGLGRGAGAADRRREEGRRHGVVVGGRPVGRVHPRQRGRRAWSPRRAPARCRYRALEAMSAVCSVGLDMVAVPGDTDGRDAGRHHRRRDRHRRLQQQDDRVRIIPVPGKQAGESVVYGGLLGEAYVQPVSRFRADRFMRLGGRIPAPLQALRN